MQRKHNIDEVKAKAISLLTRREHSCLELRNKLLTRGFAHLVIEKVIQDLIDEGLLSNQRFVEAYLKARFNKGIGQQKIRAELAQKGITEVSSELFSNYPWSKLALYLRLKKFGPEVENKEKQTRFLLQKGFSFEQINFALANQKLENEFEQNFKSIGMW